MNIDLIKANYKGRVLDYRLANREVLIVWIAGDPLVSFEVKFDQDNVKAYAFEGDLSIEEIKEGIRIFKVIYNIQDN